MVLVKVMQQLEHKVQILLLVPLVVQVVVVEVMILVEIFLAQVVVAGVVHILLRQPLSM